MNASESIIQERLERLDRGELLEACLPGLTEEEAAELCLAASLQELPAPERTDRAIAAQREALVSAADSSKIVAPAARAAPATPSLQERLQVLLAYLTLQREVVAGLSFMFIILFGLLWIGFRSADDQPSLVAEGAAVSDQGMAAAVDASDSEALPADTEADAPSNEIGAGDIGSAGDTAVNPVASGSAVDTVASVQSVAAAAPANRVFVPILSSPFLTEPGLATLHEARGLVEVQNGDGVWAAVMRNTQLAAGTRVRTGPLSSAELAFYDGSQASIGANSELSLDELSALRPGAGARLIVLTQWQGESEHQVQFRNDRQSRYEVKSGAGSGVARGTQFRVQAADGRATYTVTEGKVDVTNQSRTVSAVAGQTTTFAADEPPAPPAFIITGTGAVTEIGDTWIIAGQTFSVDPDTTIVGEPQVGDFVFVEGNLVDGSDPVADLIQLLDDDVENQFSLTGQVSDIGDAAWIIAGQTILVTPETTIEAGIDVGDTVLVTGLLLQPEGDLQASAIVQLEANGMPFEFTGVVQAITEAIWTISSIEITVNGDTEIDDGVHVGDVVTVEGTIQSDGTWLAAEIELVEAENPTFTFAGAVSSIEPWLVAGIALETADWTYIEPGIVVGDRVRVSGIILDDGTWLAAEIIRLEDGVLQIVFAGEVDSLDPWSVSGLPLATNETTVIVGDISVGDLVRVTAWIRDDGTWLATHIVWLNSGIDDGCVAVTAVINGMNGNEVVLSNGQTILLDDGIFVDGELTPGSVVLIVACVGDDGTITIISITVIYTSPPPASTPPPGSTPPPPASTPPPPQPGGNATICHKPGTPAEKTKTLPQSALGGHLGHGDTIGPCP